MALGVCIRASLAAIPLAVVATTSNTVRAATLFTDLGPGNTYNNGLSLEVDKFFQPTMEFTPKASGNVSQIGIALGGGNGESLLRLYKATSFGPALLGSWTIRNTNPVATLQQVRVGGVYVSAGSSYYLQASPLSDSSAAFWNVSSEANPSLRGAFTLASTAPTVVYLDFGANSSAVFAQKESPTLQGELRYNKPAFTGDASAVMSRVQNIYNGFNVAFTTTAPISGPYDTIYIGGTRFSTGLSQYVDSDGTNGVSRDINLGAQNPSDTAVVFSDNAQFAGNDALLAQVIAHEAGHLLGLVHVNDSTQLLWPYSNPSYAFATTIGGLTPTGESASYLGGTYVRNNGGFQDSFATLECNVGSSVSKVPDCSVLDLEHKYTHVLASSYSINPFYNAQVHIKSAYTANDTGEKVYYIGNFDPGNSYDLNLSLLPGDTLQFEGALAEGGPLQLLPSVYANGSLLVESGSQIQTPEPGSIWIILVGMGGLAYFGSRQQHIFCS